jgi:hypothetical protein
MNPVGVAFSPFDDHALLVTSDATDAYLPLSLDGGVGAPLAYVYGAPQLPGPPLLMTRGLLKGRVFIAELDAIRQLAFEPDGGFSDAAKTSLPMNNGGEIIGTFGIAP